MRGSSRDADVVTVRKLPPFPIKDGMIPPMLIGAFPLFSRGARSCRFLGHHLIINPRKAGPGHYESGQLITVHVKNAVVFSGIRPKGR